MNKEDLKPIVIGVFILVLSISLGLFLNFNNTAASKEYTSEGKLISKEVATVGGISQGGSTLGLVYKFIFKLDSGEEIKMVNQPFCATLTPGSRVKIFWHKSLFFKKIIYDYCKP